MARARHLWALVVAACAEELVLPLPSGGHVGLSTRGPSAFRVRFLFQDHEPIDTPMVRPDTEDAVFTKVEAPGGAGIKASFGSVLLLSNGALELADAGGSTITRTEPLGRADACSAQIGADVGGCARVAPPQTVPSQAACCVACQAAPGCTNWIYALKAGTNEDANCWLVTNVTGVHAASNRVLGGQGLVGVTFSSQGGKLYGRGAGKPDGQLLTVSSVTPFVENLMTYVPHYFSTDGYSALGVVSGTTGSGKTNYFPANYATDGSAVSWSFQGAFELYLMPAATLDLGSRAYYELIGAPRVPPRYAFGFIASRWGWKDRAYIEDMLHSFRSGGYPIDAFIGDFEWFTNESDYSYSPEGKSFYEDFGYNPVTFPEPQKQLDHYLRDLKVRFGGIRKPRLGGSSLLDLAGSKGWLLPGEEKSVGSQLGYAARRNLNYSIPEVRAWYAEQMLHYSKDGVSFFWNDEGETDYFTFYWWNVAQASALQQSFPKRRFYSINRAFSPGMARLGATVWTGDVSPEWSDLANTPGMVLNWGLAGAPYVGCDIGGFTGETKPDLLARWYQVGTFMPTMRVHSLNTATPHFPFLWPEPYASAMKAALELRYRLVPYHYSLAHRMYSAGRLWMRPLAAEFPKDAETAAITSQWLDGDLLVCPVLREDSTRRVYLPEGVWYAFGTCNSTKGPTSIGGQAAVDEVPVFTRPGAIIPLANVVQSTSDLPGGPLEVQVYAGADGSFELVEDDGESSDYETGAVRVVRFEWKDKARTLAWTVQGQAAPWPESFRTLSVVLFDSAHLAGPQKTPVASLGATGSITVPTAGETLYA